MTPYFQNDFVTLYHGDSREVAQQFSGTIVTDPPFNIGYHYVGYNDSLSETDYWKMLQDVIKPPCVLVHYPEQIFKYAISLGEAPTRSVAWVYNSNTRRQWRMLSWFGITPDFSRCGQPYKNPTDKRVRKLIENGREARLYDWWEVQQVKNVNSDKTSHPCQMPIEVMWRTVAITDGLIVDPFAGSGTTLLAAQQQSRKAIGIEIDERYCEVIANRLLTK